MNLHEAAGQGRIKFAESLIHKGTSVNEHDAKGNTPLHHAAILRNIAMTELLVAHGADVNARNNFGTSPLDIAKAANRSKVAAILLSRGAEAGQQKPGDALSAWAQLSPSVSRTGGTAASVSDNLSSPVSIESILAGTIVGVVVVTLLLVLCIPHGVDSSAPHSPEPASAQSTSTSESDATLDKASLATAKAPTESEVKAAVTDYIRSVQQNHDAGFSVEVMGVEPHGDGYRAWGSCGAANTSGEVAAGYWAAELSSDGKGCTVTDFTLKDAP